MQIEEVKKKIVYYKDLTQRKMNTIPVPLPKPKENADNLLFRASANGEIMTGVAKGWDVENSLTCKRRLVQMFREHTWKRRNNKTNKYTEKGVAVEEDAITLYCRVKKEMFTKNTVRLTNKYFTGELDLFRGESILKATKTIDVKSSWDWTTFPSMCDVLDSDYDYQGQTYMDLCGAESHTVAYCLVNTPANLILDEKRRLAFKMGIIETETPEYIEACIEVEKNCIYDMDLFKKHNPFFDFHCKDWQYDIPMGQRVYEIEVKRDDKKIAAMKARIDNCREWMNKNLFKL
jgi:hypothetical protein